MICLTFCTSSIGYAVLGAQKNVSSVGILQGDKSKKKSRRSTLMAGKIKHPDIGLIN